jgi:bifunctional non-homologous end joining protein LigD
MTVRTTQAMPSSIKPMLASLGQLPAPDDERWAYEFKWDGVRAIAYLDGGQVRLESRNGNDLTTSFPELRALGARLGGGSVILDGEIVAFDSHRRPSFQLLQPRIHSSDAAKTLRLAAQQPVTLIVFDILWLNGEPLLDLTYDERRQRLDQLGLGLGLGNGRGRDDDGGGGGEAWTVSPRFEGPGADVLSASKQQGLEGVVAKRTDSPYRPGKRSPEWTKVKNILAQEVVIGGWTPGQGHRTNQIGSLLLGLHDQGALAYIGQVGTGFTEGALTDLAKALEPLERESSPFNGEIPSRYRKNAHFAEPRLVGEVSFTEWTTEGRLRHPSWRGLRHDKRPEEVGRES